MRKILTILVVMVVLLVPMLATAGHHHHGHCRGTLMSHETSMDIEGDLLTITNDDRYDGWEVVISDDGDLEVNGDRIEVDGKSRKLLKKFFRETAKLEEQADLIAEDSEELAEDATAYAAAAVRKALRSLNDEEDDDELQAEFAELKDDFEGRSELIEKLGDEIGEQANRIKDLAEELQERIPELEELEWFQED
jgi:hypothetical protein